MDRPNILLIVWDACRYDYAAEHASFLNELGSSNIWFEKAIAPSPWSLPSHASIFTGEYPHEHGSKGFGDPIEEKLTEELSALGYQSYGVSANSFASQRTGFHRNFDMFRYTGGRDTYTEGLDVSGTAQDIMRNEGGSFEDALLEVLRKIPRHSSRLKSLANLVSVGCGELAMKFDFLQRIPHPSFAPTSDYSYRPEKNTRLLKSILRNHTTEEPFFIFANYMDTHRCYKPTEELQRKHIGRSLGYREIVRINEELAAPWAFEEKKRSDELDESELDDVRGLYAGEVETVDSHLESIYDTLESEDLAEDTLVVVTADHGENLGETDEMGRQRMGHEASVSEAVLHVPLVIAHPQLTPRSVNEPVSLKNLFNLFVNAPKVVESSEDDLGGVITDEPIASQYPGKGGFEETTSKHPGVESQVIKNACLDDAVVAYEDSWKIVLESTNYRWASQGGEGVDFSVAPEALVDIVEKHLTMLQEDSKNSGLSEEDIQQLEALGYI